MPDMKTFSDLWYVDIHLLHSLKGHLSIIGYIARISIVYIFLFMCTYWLNFRNWDISGCFERNIVQLDDVGLQCKMEIICYWYALNRLDWKSQFIGIHELPSHHIFCIIELSFNHLCTYFFFCLFMLECKNFFLQWEKLNVCNLWFQIFFVYIVNMQNTCSMLDLGIIWGWVTL